MHTSRQQNTLCSMQYQHINTGGTHNENPKIIMPASTQNQYNCHWQTEYTSLPYYQNILRNLHLLHMWNHGQK